MIQISLEDRTVPDGSPASIRYKEVYVNTDDFGCAARIAKAHVGAGYTINYAAELVAAVLDADGETL